MAECSKKEEGDEGGGGLNRNKSQSKNMFNKELERKRQIYRTTFDDI